MSPAQLTAIRENIAALSDPVLAAVLSELLAVVEAQAERIADLEADPRLQDFTDGLVPIGYPPAADDCPEFESVMRDTIPASEF